MYELRRRSLAYFHNEGWGTPSSIGAPEHLKSLIRLGSCFGTAIGDMRDLGISMSTEDIGNAWTELVILTQR